MSCIIKKFAARTAVACLLTMSCAGLARADLHFVTKGQSNRIIIFLDALQSEPTKSFRWGEGVASWPELMAKDEAGEAAQLPLARYDSALLSFGGASRDRATVPQLATRALAELKSRGVVESYQSIIFVAQGAGGLVLKSMLVQSTIAGTASLSAKTKVVFLLSVPAEGRPAASFLATLLQNQALAVDFGTIDIGLFLQGLDSLWSEYLARRSATRRLEIYCRSETDASFGQKVAAGQYTTGGCDDNGQEPGTDHDSIARPASREAGMYVWVRHHIADYFQRFPSDPGKAAPPPAVVAAATVKSGEGQTIAIPAVPTSPAMAPAAPVVAAPVAAAVPPPVPPPASAEPSPAAVLAQTPSAGDFTPVAPAGQTVPSGQASLKQSSAPAAGRHTDTAPSASARTTAPAPHALRNGEWTFALRDTSCNLKSQLWVVQLRDRHLTSSEWDTRISPDGHFTINAPAHCGRETVQGQVSGTYGSGWYIYSDQCLSIYCKSRFTLTWRRPAAAGNPRAGEPGASEFLDDWTSWLGYGATANHR